MLYLIGLGLNENGISKEGLLALKKCKKIYLEEYTVDFPYNLEDLHLDKKIIKLKREDVESSKLIKEAKGRKIALLAYGSPLFATTHMTLILDAEKEKVKVRVIYSASVFDAIAETGLQLYKFGKTASMPDQSKGESDFLKYAEENKTIGAHSLILIDIGMSYKKALDKLEQACKDEDIKLDKIIVCGALGTEKSKILYGKIEKLKEQKAEQPFCFIIPSEMHFLEKEAVERFKL